MNKDTVNFPILRHFKLIFGVRVPLDKITLANPYV